MNCDLGKMKPKSAETVLGLGETGGSPVSWGIREMEEEERGGTQGMLHDLCEESLEKRKGCVCRWNILA